MARTKTFVRAALAAVLTAGLAVGGVATLTGPATAAAPVVACRIAAAGDIGKTKTSGIATGKLIEKVNPEAVIALGDLAYKSGTTSQFNKNYDPAWGKFKSKTYPTPGNHEHYTSKAAGYRQYWGARGGAANYGFDFCGWRILAVDTEESMSAAARFVTDERAARPTTPILLFTHKPGTSSGKSHGSETGPQKPLLAAAVNAKVAVWLAGHDHSYERFAAINGLQQFVIGTGGAPTSSFGKVRAGSEKRIKSTGVGFFDFTPGGYSSEFQNTKGKVLDRTPFRAVG